MNIECEFCEAIFEIEQEIFKTLAVSDEPILCSSCAKNYDNTDEDEYEDEDEDEIEIENENENGDE